MRAKLIGIALGSLLALAAAPALAAPNTQLSVGTDGTFSAKNLVVYQKSGSALYCRAVWGDAFVRLTVLVVSQGAGTSTALVKNHGAAASIDDIAAGDLLNVVGTLQSGADTLLVNAATIDDLSLNTEGKSAAGTIKSVGQGSFTLSDKKLGTVTVLVGSSTIQKGARTISPAELSAGDKVVSLSGAYDYTTQTLSAQGTIVVYQDQSLFNARNFQGTIKSISGTTLPTSIIVSTNGADYQVFLPAAAKIYSKSFAPTALSRFAVGDTVRFWGAIRQDNLADVDATILRDLNF